jgi:hypothetical protein
MREDGRLGRMQLNESGIPVWRAKKKKLVDILILKVQI